jgi:hypothetical protein
MSREEMIRYQDLRRSAFIRGTAGALALLAAVLYEGNGGDNGAVTMAGIYGGFEGIKSALEKRAEANVSRDALNEAGTGFNAEAEPLVIEVEGQTRRLTGTAEARYKEWRRLLREIYSAETGAPLPEPQPEPQTEPVAPAAVTTGRGGAVLPDPVPAAR